MGLTLVAPPIAWPVTLQEAKIHLRAGGSTVEDAYIEGLIRTATLQVEKRIGLSLMERTYRLTADAFEDAILLPRGPVKSVTSVKYYDLDGSQQILAMAAYTVDTTSDRNWLIRNADSTWPLTLAAVNAVEIEYIAGAAELPVQFEDAAHAIKVMIGEYYRNREAGALSADAERSIKGLLRPYKRHTL